MDDCLALVMQLDNFHLCQPHDHALAPSPRWDSIRVQILLIDATGNVDTIKNAGVEPGDFGVDAQRAQSTRSSRS